MDSSAASTPRLCSSAREMASAIERGIVPGVAGPEGTPPRNGRGICEAACAAARRGAPAHTTSRTGTSSTDLTNLPFSPDAARRKGTETIDRVEQVRLRDPNGSHFPEYYARTAARGEKWR